MVCRVHDVCHFVRVDARSCNGFGISLWVVLCLLRHIKGSAFAASYFLCISAARVMCVYLFLSSHVFIWVCCLVFVGAIVSGMFGVLYVRCGVKFSLWRCLWRFVCL